MRVLISLQFLVAVLALNASSCGGIGASPDATVTDMPDEGPLGHTMKRHARDFEACGRDSVSIQTGSTQKVKLKFMVTAEGKAVKPKVLGMGDPDPDFQLCLMKVLKKIDFPKPADGQPKPVNYPLTIKPE